EDSQVISICPPPSKNRSEVSSSSSSESLGQSGRQLTVKVLLHSQNLQASEQPDHQDCEILSSQEDLFDAEKSGAAVDSTVAEPEQQAQPTSTPANTLRLLHLSGQGTLVQESLNPWTPHFHQRRKLQKRTIRWKRRQPRGPTHLPPPLNPLVRDRIELSLQDGSKKSSSLPSETQSELRDSTPFTAPLQLSVNTQSSSPLPVEEDSQATQIEELEEPPGVDTSDSVTSCHVQENKRNAVNSALQAAESSNQPSQTEQKPDLSQEPGMQKRAEAALNVQNVNVNEISNSNHSDVAANSCVQETPCTTTPCSLPSQSVISQSSPVDVSSVSLRGETAKTQAVEHQQVAASDGPTDNNRMDDCEQPEAVEEEEEELVMEEENTGGASGMALVLSQSQLMSPEPMEEEIQDRSQDSIIVVTDSEKDAASQSKTSISEPIGSKRSVTANSHQRQTQEERADVALDGSPQSGSMRQEPESVKDKSLSDSSGEPALSEEDESVTKVTTVSMAVTRGKLFASPQRSSQVSSLCCNSLPNSQSELSQQDVLSAPQNNLRGPHVPAEPSDKRQEPSEAPNLPLPNSVDGNSWDVLWPVGCLRLQLGLVVLCFQESEEPVVDCQVLDSDISPCRTGSSSVTSGDLGDISSLLSKASSLHHSSGGTSSSTGPTRPDFIMPPNRGFKSIRGHRAGSVVTVGRGGSTFGSRAFVPLTPRGRARRGRPPSHSSLSRGVGVGPLQRLGAHAQTHSSSEDEPYTCMLPPRLPISPADPEHSVRLTSLRSSPEEAFSAGSSFVGLRVVAKWSSNGYFYSGRITKNAGDGRFRLRFDDGYECEVAGKDILLCDPIPLETEVTALLEDEYFSIGVVKGHKTEGQELFYSVEKDGQRQWYNRTAVILSLEQGNKLREQHSLGPYEPTTPLTKASDISLGKKRCLERTLYRGQRVGICNTSGSGTDLPGRSCDVAETHGPLPQNTSLFMGFAFMLTASSEVDRMTNKLTSDDEDYVQTGPYNKPYTEAQLQAGGGFILPDFNEEQVWTHRKPT
ncbi:hypothetical protein GOODEAATRI_012416, partial [Goodea atripinnis]